MGLVLGVIFLVLGVVLLVGAIGTFVLAVLTDGLIDLLAVFSPAMFAVAIVFVIKAVLNLREGN